MIVTKDYTVTYPKVLGHAVTTSVYTLGERDLILELIDAIHKGNDDIFTKLNKPDKDSNDMTCYTIGIACPINKQHDLSALLAYALKIYNNF